MTIDIDSLIENHINPNDLMYNKFKLPEIKYALKAIIEHDSGVSWVDKLENAFSKKMGVKYAIACNSGTSGLHAALFAADIGKEDEVIVPALTVVMDAYAILHLGATPIFADVDIETHLITAEQIEKKITNKTKAIITVSWEGLSCDMDPIMTLARKYNLKVIDDSARTVLGKYKNKVAGTIADINVFSFESKKHISAAGEGGMIVTNCEDLAVKARKFSGIGYKHMSAIAGRTHLAIDTVQDPNYKRFDTMGLNYRMNNITAAIALGQIERLDEIVDKRKLIGNMYLEKFSDIDWFVPQRTPKDCINSYYTFSVDYKGEEKFGLSWKGFYKKFKELGGDGFYGVVAIPYTETVFIQNAFKNVNLTLGQCPNAELLQSRVMCFKTNYRNIEDAKKNINILTTLIKSVSKN